MAKKAKAQGAQTAPAPNLFTALGKRRYRVLILARVLREEADRFVHRDDKQKKAHAVLLKWADLEKQGYLAKKKETALDASFLHEVFGEALGYKLATNSPDKYQLERNFTVPGVGTADGAIGEFTPTSMSAPAAVIELKDALTNLDTDKFNGRTPVQQCWDYPPEETKMIPCKVDWHHSALLVTFEDRSSLLLQSDSDKVAFCASSGLFRVPNSWDGRPSITTDWADYDPTDITECPEDYLEIAELWPS